MTAANSCQRSDCPIACALDVLGDKWTLLVLRDMVFLGKQHFNELLDTSEGIASNILAERLKRLTAAGIITRSTDPENRRRRIYTLTDKGLDLILSADGREILQYLSPDEFSAHRAQLQY